MPDEKNVVQVSLEVDSDGLQQGLDQGIQRMRQGVERLNALSGQNQEPAVVSGAAGSAPPPPAALPPFPGTAAPPPVPGAAGGGDRPETDSPNYREELAGIREQAQNSPDLALLRLVGAGGSGGLLSQVQKGAMGAGDPETEREHQEMLEAIRDLTKGIRRQIQATDNEGGLDPASQILGFMRHSALMQVGGGIASNAMQGNLLGAGGGALGGGIGFLMGGPLGAQAGAQVGTMLGSGAQQFLSGASESQQYSMQAADIAARFGDASLADDELSIGNISQMSSSGYSTQETAGLLDQLRQQNLIETVDEEAIALTESIQELTRATGINTEALVSQYASYQQTGGEKSAEGYMAQVIAGAVSVGMRENLDQYSELLSSNSAQLVYSGGVGDYSGGGTEGVQDILYNLLGQNNKMSELLGNNPMMAQQMIGSLMGTGASSSMFGMDAAMMQMAGIDASKTTAGYISPEQQTSNILARQKFIADQFLGMSGTLGYDSAEELQSAAQQNPELIQQALTNGPQATQLQAQLDTSIATQYGKSPEQLTAQERQTTMQLLQAYITQGTLTPDTAAGDGEGSIADLIAESQKTEGEQAREAAAERHKEMMDIMEEFAPLLTAMDESMVDILESIKPFMAEVAPAIIKISEAINSFMGSRIAQGAQSLNEHGIVGGTARNVLNNSPVGFLRDSARVGGAIATGNLDEVKENRDELNPITDLGLRGLESLQNRLFGARGRRAESEPSAGRSPSAGMAAGGGDRQFFSGRNAAPVQGVEEPLPQSFVNAEFNDTPAGGVVARDGFNTFRFAPGDVVQARMGEAPGGGSTNIQGNITVVIDGAAGGDPAIIERSAREGSRAGFDEFFSRWRASDGNEPRLRQAF